MGGTTLKLEKGVLRNGIVNERVLVTGVKHMGVIGNLLINYLNFFIKRGSFLGGKGGTPLRNGHKESYTYLNLKNSTSEWDSNPRPHEY